MKVVHLLVALILFIIGSWGAFLYLRSRDTSFLSVETAPQVTKLVSPPRSELLRGSPLVAEFKGTLPHLGIVSIRFDTKDRINQDRLQFSIKQKNEIKWYYENSYNTDQFQPEGLFPFGFPPIANSENEIFQVNLISKSGTPSSVVAVSQRQPTITTVYVFNLEELKFNHSLLLRFLWYKLNNVFSDPHVTSHLIVSFLPFFVYLFFYHRTRKYLALFTFTLFILLINLPRIAPASVTEIVSAIAVISLIILTAKFVLKINRYNNRRA